MIRRVQRGWYGAEALTEAEIQKLETSPETAADHIDHDCNSCRNAARDQRAALEPILSDLLALAHGHAPARPGQLRCRDRDPRRRHTLPLRDVRAAHDALVSAAR